MAETVTEQVARDVFPATVTLGEDVIARVARVFISNRRMLVFEAVDGHVVLRDEFVVDEPILRSRDSLHGALSVLTDQGKVWLNKAGGGCHCHSVLKAMAAPDGMSWTR